MSPSKDMDLLSAYISISHVGTTRGRPGAVQPAVDAATARKCMTITTREQCEPAGCRWRGSRCLPKPGSREDQINAFPSGRVWQKTAVVELDHTRGQRIGPSYATLVEPTDDTGDGILILPVGGDVDHPEIILSRIADLGLSHLRRRRGRLLIAGHSMGAVVAVHVALQVLKRAPLYLLQRVWVVCTGMLVDISKQEAAMFMNAFFGRLFNVGLYRGEFADPYLFLNSNASSPGEIPVTLMPVESGRHLSVLPVTRSARWWVYTKSKREFLEADDIRTGDELVFTGDIELHNFKLYREAILAWIQRSRSLH